MFQKNHVYSDCFHVIQYGQKVEQFPKNDMLNEMIIDMKYDTGSCL